MKFHLSTDQMVMVMMVVLLLLLVAETICRSVSGPSRNKQERESMTPL